MFVISCFVARAWGFGPDVREEHLPVRLIHFGA
jgi:hypothetical protein